MCERMCEVEGCGGTNGVYRHKKTGILACKACRTAYGANGTFVRKTRNTKARFAVCQVANCNSKIEVYYHSETGLMVCQACRHCYKRYGTFDRPRRTHTYNDVLCAVCKTRKATRYRVGNSHKPRCHRCYAYFRHHRRERPRQTRYTKELRCQNCKRSTESNARRTRYCYMCESYKKRNGQLPDADHIAKYAPHGWCECGKPAEVQIDLRTGGLLVVPTKTGMTDYLTGTREEYAEWVCRECAGYEDEMQRTGGNTYEPSSYIKRG